MKFDLFCRRKFMNISGLIILYLAVFVTLVGLVSALITIHSFFEAHRHPKIKQRPIIVSIVFIASMFVLAAILTPVSCVVGKTSTSEPSPTTNNQTPTALPSPTASPQSSTTSVPISPTATYGGTLVLDDPLKDNSHGYNWDETDGHCTFKGGAYLVATSNPNNYECNTNSSRTDFSNFSYQ